MTEDRLADVPVMSVVGQTRKIHQSKWFPLCPQQRTSRNRIDHVRSGPRTEVKWHQYRLGAFVFLNPDCKQFPDHRQYDWAQKQAGDAVGEMVPPHDAEHNNQCRRVFNPRAMTDRPKNIVRADPDPGSYRPRIATPSLFPLRSSSR